MTTPLSSLLLAGCGKMGSALLARWQQNKIAAHYHVIEPAQTHSASPNTSWHKTLDALPAEVAPDVIVFAVKPQQMDALLVAYGTRFGQKPLYISIAAGKTLPLLHKYLGERAQVVRAMPNTPALAGAGMTVLSAGNLPERPRHTAALLMQAAGKVEWVDEALMDAVTAISGSGPAYVFLFLEALTKAGIDAGLTPQLAGKLAVETVGGSVELVRQSGEKLEQLRKNVTSPGGTTEAALAVLMQDNALETLVKNAVQAAKKRAGELK